jgi:hypothetical protein
MRNEYKILVEQSESLLIGWKTSQTWVCCYNILKL